MYKIGKTLECIAVILLNPQLERNPIVEHWDENVQLSVRTVKTTLIVTPLSLAQQWVRLCLPTTQTAITNNYEYQLG